MYAGFLKRGLDVIFSILLLLFLFPLLLIVSGLILILDGQPVFFVQTRPGKNGIPFKIWKFRTMRKDAEGKLSDVQRITRTGHWLRKTSIDELPQLWNVICGEMSLIGPRPLLMEYLPLYNQRQQKRHLVRPGITGLAQVHGRNATTWRERLEWDVIYTEKLSFWLDCKILVATGLIVLGGSGVSKTAEVTMEPFQGDQ